MPADTSTTPKPPDTYPSVEAWTSSPQFRQMMADEFPADAAEWLDPVSRRAFLSLSAASVALAAGCNPSIRPMSRHAVLPYVKQPEQVLPGVPLFFATSMPQAGGVALGLIVKQHEGRPIKVEGNPDHPGTAGGGGCNLAALAAPLDLYDPDRSQKPLTGDARATTSFEKLVAGVRARLRQDDPKAGKADGGERVRVLTEPTTSPTVVGLMERFLAKYPKAKWVQYEPATRDNGRRAILAAFGKALNPVVNVGTANVILSLDADFLACGPAAVAHARQFGDRRKVSTTDALDREHDHEKAAENAAKSLNRLYVVEGYTTPTGAIADHRLPLKPSQVETFARALAAKLGVAGVKAPADDLPDTAKKWLDPLAADLQANPGKALVLAGDEQSPATHLLALAINEKLGAFGGEKPLVALTDPLDVARTAAGFPTADQTADLKGLARDMADGKVDCLLLSGVNPVYDAPADLNFLDAIKSVRKLAGSVVLHHGLYEDETALHANWHLNAAHFLEAWGDGRGHDGTVGIQQPLIAPLYNGKSLVELLTALLEESPSDALGQVKAAFRRLRPNGEAADATDRAWEAAVKAGVVAGSAPKPAAPPEAVSLAQLDADGWSVKPIKELEIQFRPDPTIGDGRQANNGWLQELPKPITNLCWDNAAIVSPRTAERLKIEHGYTVNTYRSGERGCTETDVATLTVGERKLEAAVHVLPGHADEVVTLHLGYGRERSGRVATPTDEGAETPGFNAYKLRGTDAAWTAPVKLERTNKRHFLAIAGAHAAMESRRPVRTASVAQFVNDPKFAQVPAVAAGETDAIRKNTPGTVENFAQLGMHHPHDHSHGHEEGHHEHTHDKRVLPLNLYHDNPIKVRRPDGSVDDANKSYRRWAMAIDLGSCTGCAACTLACVAENNTPVVGKEQVHRGRAMHWIRIDRYYSIPTPGKLYSDEYGEAGYGRDEKYRKEQSKRNEEIRIHPQPVPCQQCEKAPCEVVCPVGATVHSADGLNDMAYNRCVGTRYCSNNCPYKVRRFNFLQYTDYSTPSLKLVNNPEVTVRTRGVMEKCTYCVQRIRNAEIEAEREWDSPARSKDKNGRPKILDGEVVTACQQACPTNAIHFGDMSDDSARILRYKAEPHTYGLLAELNTMPRTTYLAAVKNPNEALEQALAAGKGA